MEGKKQEICTQRTKPVSAPELRLSSWYLPLYTDGTCHCTLSATLVQSALDVRLRCCLNQEWDFCNTVAAVNIIVAT